MQQLSAKKVFISIKKISQMPQKETQFVHFTDSTNKIYIHPDVHLLRNFPTQSLLAKFDQNLPCP